MLIVPLLGFGILGNFSLAIQIVNVGLILTMIIFKYTIVYDAQGKDNKKLKKFTIIISVIFAIVGAIISPYIIPSIFPEYIEVIDVIQIISFSIIPITITKIFSSKLLGQENSRQIVYSKIVSIITFTVGIVILTPEFGILGLATSYLLSMVFETIWLIPLKNYTKK